MNISIYGIKVVDGLPIIVPIVTNKRGNCKNGIDFIRMLRESGLVRVDDYKGYVFVLDDTDYLISTEEILYR